MDTEGIPILRLPSCSSLPTGDSTIKFVTLRRSTTLFQKVTRGSTTSNRTMYGVPTSLTKSHQSVEALYRGIRDIHTMKKSNTKTRVTSFRISMREARDLRSEASFGSIFKQKQSLTSL